MRDFQEIGNLDFDKFLGFLLKTNNNSVSWISENLIYTYFVGLVIGMMIVDFSYSIHLATKLREYKEYANLRFEDYKKALKERFKVKRH